jgi:hypothetical protein
MDLGNGSLDPLKVVGGQFDSVGADVLVETMHFGRPRNRDDPRSLCQQPREGDLSASCVFLIRDFT